MYLNLGTLCTLGTILGTKSGIDNEINTLSVHTERIIFILIEVTQSE